MAPTKSKILSIPKLTFFKTIYFIIFIINKNKGKNWNVNTISYVNKSKAAAMLLFRTLAPEISWILLVSIVIRIHIRILTTKIRRRRIIGPKINRIFSRMISRFVLRYSKELSVFELSLILLYVSPLQYITHLRRTTNAYNITVVYQPSVYV